MLTSSNDLQSVSYWPCSSLPATTNTEPSKSLWPSELGFAGESGLLPIIHPRDVTSTIHDLTEEDNMNIYNIQYPEKLQESSINVMLRSSSSLSYEITAKKSDHNVKEKLRRMKLNDAYSSLKSLLPDSYKSKKKWSSPVVVAKVLEYIPDLQEEVEKLRQTRDHMLLSIQKKQSIILPEDHRVLSSSDSSSVPIVSMSEINEGEIIAQICVQRDHGPHRTDVIFSSLLVKVEREGIQIISASTLLISTERVCFNLHLMKGSSFQPTLNDVDLLRDKIVLWLCELIPAGGGTT